jgi:hypothetical protein
VKGQCQAMGVPLYFFATYEAFAITFEMKIIMISIQKLNE